MGWNCAGSLIEQGAIAMAPRWLSWLWLTLVICGMLVYWLAADLGDRNRALEATRIWWATLLLLW